MELGKKLLQARQEAGLSQRQLCGDVITRNMLSQIEHGTARPSMDTLRYLAGKLGKPVSFFLEEDVVTSSNQPLIQQARAAWQAGKIEKTRQYLKEYRFPDETFLWEWQYLTAVSTLAAAEQAISDGKTLYARQLLEELETGVFPELDRKRYLLLGRIPGADLPAIACKLPAMDEELLLRAEGALAQGDMGRAAALLSAAEFLLKAEPVYPKDCASLLETCFRELGDFKLAYEYACKQR